MLKVKNIQEGNINFLYFLLLISTILISAISIGIGVADIRLSDILSIIGNELFQWPLNDNITTGQVTIITQLRIPRIIVAVIVGANLAVTGSIYQALFRNAMADPFMLGISSGASLGAGIGFVLGSFTPIYAFIGAVISNLFVFILAGVKGKSSTIRLLLSGMAINYLFSAILSLLRFYSTDKDLTLFAWGMGSLAGASYDRVKILLLISIPVHMIFYIYRKELNLIMLGDDVAKSLGQDVSKVRILFLVLSSLLIATTVSFTGTVGFVGLIIPHMVRLMFGSNYKITFPIHMFFGMIFVVLCDNISRSILSSSEVPLGIVTSLFGAPYFMYLIYKERKGN